MRIEHQLPALRDLEMPAPGVFDQPCLGNVGLRPMHTVSEKRLLSGRQKFCSLFRGEAELLGKAVNGIPNADLPFRRGGEDREHQGLIVGNRHAVAFFMR